jgi:uncharacterized protein (TIGR03437 family)
LLLLGGVVYTAWSSHCDIGLYHGWLIGYNAATLQQVAVYNNTPNGNEASFWGGGAAPAADAAGNIYLVAGNGTFDMESGGSDVGESFTKLSSAGGLALADYFTPFNFGQLNPDDLDVGSAGVALAGDEAGSSAHPHLMVGGGKEGRIYVLDRDNLGHWKSGSDSQIVASIPGAIEGLFGKPAYFNKTVYFCGSGDNLKAFTLSNAAMAATPASQSPESFGFPGCVPTISASGTSNGIVWVLETAGILHAYDASNVANELYSSNQNSARDSLGDYVKFSVPIVANGKVYAGTGSFLVVYGMFATLSVENTASGQQNIAAPGSIVSLYGSALAQMASPAGGFPLPTELAGASVTINNAEAPLIFANPGQINAQVPFDTPLGGASISVSVAGSAAGAGTFVAQAIAPGLFLINGTQAAALNQDGSVNGPSQPASAGTAIAAYLTGLGAVDNFVASGAAAPSSPLSRATSAVTATIGGQPAQVVFAGLAPGFAGLYQMNIVVPQLTTGSYSLQVTVGGVGSNIGTISVQ